MSTSEHSYLKPLLANLSRMEIGRFCAEKSFDLLMLQHNLDEEWKLEKELLAPVSGHFDLPRDLYAAREGALSNMLVKLSDGNLERAISAGYVVVGGMLRWQPNNEHLVKAINEFPRVDRSDNRSRALQQLLKQERDRSAKALPRDVEVVTVESKPHSLISKNVFVVHGHAVEDRLKLTRLLEKNLGLFPDVVQEEANESFETIFQKIERLAGTCDTAIVLVTPDDECKAGMRPRENVVLELGYFLGLWKHEPQRRILVLRKGDVNLLTDISGVVYVRYDNEPKECYAELQSQLRAWGVPIT